MRRPSNHAIFNKLRPSEVGLEADKPENIQDGASYFATDTYRLYYGGNKGERPFVTKGFPYNLLTQDPNGNDVFRFFVDPIEGNDDNSGQLWSQAKKTLSSIFDLLPQDLMGNTVRIFVQGGTEEVSNFNYTINNGSIWVLWCGLFINTNTGDWADWRRGGEVNPIRSNDQFIMKGTNPEETTIVIQGADLAIGFLAKDEEIAHWQPGHCYYDRFIIQDADTAISNQHDYMVFANVTKFELLGFGLKPLACRTSLVMTYATEGGFAGIRIHDTSFADDTALHKPDDVWKGAFLLRGNHASNKFSLGKISPSTGSYIKYATDFAPPGYDGGASQTLVIDGELSTLYVNGGGACKGVYIDLDANDLTYSGVEVPKMLTSSDFEGTIQYPSAQLTLTDNSTRPRVIKDYTTGIETIYLTNGIQQAGANVIFDLTTSDPSVAGALWNDAGTVKVSVG